MSEIPADVDPIISEHVVAIRNRFGLDGLRQAANLIAVELAIFSDADEGIGDSDVG
jgi:hypothetical protein